MIVYFIRHGETDFNKQGKIQGRSDIPLNGNGIHQAEMAAAHFREQGIGFDRVYASPLRRALKTASVISGWPESAIQTDERVQEMSFGIAEGMIFDTLPASIMNLFVKPEIYEAPEGAESIEALRQRCGQFLDMLLKVSDTEPEVHTVLVATHGAALRGLISCMEGGPDAAFWKKGLTNCAYVRAHVDQGKWRVDGIVNPLPQTAPSKGKAAVLN